VGQYGKPGIMHHNQGFPINLAGKQPWRYFTATEIFPLQE
jgi:hypothetical protein